VLESSPARLEHARALISLGRVERRAGQREKARRDFLTGLDIASACCPGGRLAGAARIELTTMGARPRRDRITGRDALTASELRVARLAAEGRTNREIAEALWVTLRTVETHLSHSYAKLAISSRGELSAALANQT
jgi:DNA-binding CsgD family transcriptional regulator